MLGGGHGLTAVLSALRHHPAELTAIVTVADDGGSSGELRRRREGPAVGDMRRALISLADDDAALARAFARPLSIETLGSHPLGNLVIRSVTDAFGDLEQASEWLGRQLGVSGRVLPASAEPVSLLAEAENGIIEGEQAIGAARVRIKRIRFSPERPAVPKATREKVREADLVLLGPGSLFTSVLAACALPDVARALARTAGRVVWICNLEPEPVETAGMTAWEHLAALRRHGVRVDAVLYDPRAKLHFDADRLSARGYEPLPRLLRSARPGAHDPALLRVALEELFARPRRERMGRPAAPGSSSTAERFCAMRAIPEQRPDGETSDSQARGWGGAVPQSHSGSRV
ncbi:MAG: YvcK family protein [Solirubrobacterales bacterium]|nr:YvcK family protein [Solirubrobacterales bacterium]